MINIMVANNIDAIRHGTLINVQVQLQQKILTNVIERVQNKIIRISIITLIYNKKWRYSENDIETVQTQQRFSENFYRLTTKLFKIIHKACKFTMGAIIRCKRWYKLIVAKHVSLLKTRIICEDTYLVQIGDTLVDIISSTELLLRGSESRRDWWWS